MANDLYGAIDDEELKDEDRQEEDLWGREKELPGVSAPSKGSPVASPLGVSGNANVASPAAPPSEIASPMASKLPDHLAEPSVAGPQPSLDLKSPVASPNAHYNELAAQKPYLQSKHGFGGALLKGLDIAGTVLSPGTMMAIPGTSAHHAFQLREENERENQDLSQKASQSKTDLEKAEAEKLRNPPEKQTEAGKTVTVGDKVMQWNPATSRYDIPVGPQKEGAPHYEKLADGTVIALHEKDGKSSAEVIYKGDPKVDTELNTRIIGGVPHSVLINKRTGEDIKDLGQTKLPGEAPAEKRSAAELVQVEREARGHVAKAEQDFNNARAASNMQREFIKEAKGGNKAAVKIVPLEGALEITTSQGVHRINKTEVDQYGHAGSLFDRIHGAIGGGLTGKDIPDNVLDDMDRMTQEVAKNAYGKYKNEHEYNRSVVEGYGGKDFEKRVPLAKEEQGETQQGAKAEIPEGTEGTWKGKAVVRKGGKWVPK